jgi:hypothetical protein
MLKHIRLFPFVAGLIIGFIAIILIKPEKNVVYKYPTPDNAGKIIYKDKNNICYKYNAKQLDCDKNESRLKDYPLNK